MNNARCTQARKTTYGLDKQHQDVDRTLCGTDSQNDREWRKYILFVANPRIEDGWLSKEQNKPICNSMDFKVDYKLEGK